MQEDKDTYTALSGVDTELSVAWLELLGKQTQNSSEGDAPVPSLESDPWSSLVQSQGIQAINVQAVHLQMSDEDIDQVLVHMQDQSTHHPEP